MGDSLTDYVKLKSGFLGHLSLPRHQTTQSQSIAYSTPHPGHNATNF